MSSHFIYPFQPIIYNCIDFDEEAVQSDSKLEHCIEDIEDILNHFPDNNEKISQDLAQLHQNYDSTYLLLPRFSSRYYDIGCILEYLFI